MIEKYLRASWGNRDSDNEDDMTDTADGETNADFTDSQIAD
jgi:hypothetical protein